MARQNFEAAAAAHELRPRVSQILVCSPVEREACEIDASLLAQLRERKTKVDVQPQMLGPHLEKDAPAVESIAQIAELPQQLARLVLATDPIAHNDPAPSHSAVHHE